MSVSPPQVLYLEMRTALFAKILIIPEPWQKMHCLAKSQNGMIKTPIKALQVGSLTGWWMERKLQEWLKTQHGFERHSSFMSTQIVSKYVG